MRHSLSGRDKSLDAKQPFGAVWYESPGGTLWDVAQTSMKLVSSPYPKSHTIILCKSTEPCQNRPARALDMQPTQTHLIYAATNNLGRIADYTKHSTRV